MVTAVRPEKSAHRFAQLVQNPWRLAAIALLLFLSAVNVYRAATQSITHDEAVTWEWLPFSGSVSQFFDSQIANHHPLNNLLAKIMVDLFGLSEFSMRIPSLLGGFLYFYAVYRISAFLFGEGFLFLLSVSLLSLNPFVLDYLSCARGYAAGVGFLLYAIYQATRYLSQDWHPQNANQAARLLNKAGIAVGLSVGFNVVMIFPCGAFTAALFAILLADSIIARPALVETALSTANPKRKKQGRRRLKHAQRDYVGRSVWQALLHFFVPAIVVGGLILSLPRYLIYFEVGYEGPPSLRAILESVVRPSFLHSPAGHLGLASWFSPELAIRLITDLVIPAGLAALVVVAVRIVYNWIRLRNFDALPTTDRFLLLLAYLFPTALLMILVSHYVFHAPYPEQRTVLYWIPLLGLTCVCFMKRLHDSGRIGRMVAVPIGAFVIFCIVQFATQFNTRYYAEWAYCAGTKDIMAVMRDRHALKPGDKVRVGVTWQLEPGVNFYRVMWGLDWMNKVERESADGDYDYYILLFDDVNLVRRRGLKLLLRDKLSGAVLAEPVKS